MDEPRPQVPHVALPHKEEILLDPHEAHSDVPGTLYGLMAEFDTVEALTEATQRTRDAGYQHIDAYTPFPSHAVADALGVRGTRVPLIVLIGAIVGLVSGYFLQYYTAVIDYPLNVGGRPLHSWVSFIPVTFELTILVAGFAAVFGMLALNGLPQPYHPVFNVPRFSEASRDRFFLVIETKDPLFSYDETLSFLESLGSREVMDVPE